MNQGRDRVGIVQQLPGRCPVLSLETGTSERFASLLVRIDDSRELDGKVEVVLR